MAYQCESLGVNTETSPQFSLVGTSPMHFLRWGGFEMRITLTDEQHLMLELIADKPLPAIPEIARYTGVLAACSGTPHRTHRGKSVDIDLSR